MTTVTHAPPRGVVSFSLLLAVSARRIATRLGQAPELFVRPVLATYRNTGDRWRAFDQLADLAHGAHLARQVAP